jgi:cation/acetate symporter
MVATTWVQIIKAVLLLFGGTLLAGLALSRFGFSLDTLFSKAVAVHKNGAGILLPSKLVADPIAMISLSIGLVFGTAALDLAHRHAACVHGDDLVVKAGEAALMLAN